MVNTNPSTPNKKEEEVGDEMKSPNEPVGEKKFCFAYPTNIKRVCISRYIQHLSKGFQRLFGALVTHLIIVPEKILFSIVDLDLL